MYAYSGCKYLVILLENSWKQFLIYEIMMERRNVQQFHLFQICVMYNEKVVLNVNNEDSTMGLPIQEFTDSFGA